MAPMNPAEGEHQDSVSPVWELVEQKFNEASARMLDEADIDLIQHSDRAEKLPLQDSRGNRLLLMRPDLNFSDELGELRNNFVIQVLVVWKIELTSEGSEDYTPFRNYSFGKWSKHIYERFLDGGGVTLAYREVGEGEEQDLIDMISLAEPAPEDFGTEEPDPS